MSLPDLSPSRRTALFGAVAGLVAVAGCDDADPRNGPAVGPSTGVPAADDVPDPDTALVEETLIRINGALAVVTAAQRRHRDLRPALRPFVRMHQEHLRALEQPAPGRTSSPGAAGLDQVRRAEQALQRQLVDAAVRAESGALARLLASMSAAVAQRLAVLT